MRSWVVTLCCLVASVAWAQKTVTVVASYTYHVPENVTVDAGVPVLCMHAPLEIVSKLDCYETMKACRAIYLA